MDVLGFPSFLREYIQVDIEDYFLNDLSFHKTLVRSKSS